MHPKAAYLALNGFVPVRLISSGAKRYMVLSSMLRIKRQLEDMEPQLVEIYNSAEACQQQTSTCAEWGIAKSASVDIYIPISWDIIPDEVMDKIPQELIEKFVTTC